MKRISMAKIGDPNNLSKLTAIYLAMKKINEIDKSDYFKNYYSEIIGRLLNHACYELAISNVQNKSIEDKESIIDAFLKI